MKRAIVWLSVLVGVTLIGLLIWVNRYNEYDFVRLYNYIPPVGISNLANETTMTPYAKRLFYVYHPVVENNTQFNKDCTVTEQAIVLGCTRVNLGIYLFNVQDTVLNGISQVTAAHEMLHAAYARLSASEQKSVDSMVMSAYYQLAPTHTLLQTEYQSYVKTEGVGAVPNEMHSILGTEVSTLPSQLESYYKKYFTNRQVIANYASQYQSVFTSRQAEVEKDDQQLSNWRQTISANENNLQTQQQNIQNLSSSLNQLKASVQIAQYNSEVGVYNSTVDNYNSLANQTKSVIASFNQLIAQRNAAALSENKLVQSISSMPSTINPK